MDNDLLDAMFAAPGFDLLLYMFRLLFGMNITAYIDVQGAGYD